MTSQEMIDKIYEVAADKTLSEWCIIQTRENSCDICSPWEYCWHKQYFRKWSMWYDETIFFDRWRIKLEDWISYWEWFWYKIIWHPVMIGDVLDYLQSNSLLSECIDLLWIWNNKRKPIENQSEECITYIYNLITSHVPEKENNN